MLRCEKRGGGGGFNAAALAACMGGAQKKKKTRWSGALGIKRRIKAKGENGGGEGGQESFDGEKVNLGVCKGGEGGRDEDEARQRERERRNCPECAEMEDERLRL